MVEDDVEYPIDSGLLAKAVGRIARQAARVQAADGAQRIRVRDRRRPAGHKVRLIAANLKRRSGEAKDGVSRTTGDLADPGETAAGEVTAVVRNDRGSLDRAGEAASGQLG